MIIICTASADTYITDKIINGNIRVTDANVGNASTIDLFKLYDETKLNNTGTQTELSRGLLKFDLSPITALTASILDLNSSRFSATLEMKDIMTGHAVPRNFTLSVFPLSQSFDEGIGIDTGKFNDVDVANFVTASYTTQNNIWFVTGANAGGLLSSNNIDYITSGNLQDGSGVVSFEKKQTFTNGTEDLAIDLTTLVSATVAAQLLDHGFRLSFTGSQEADTKSRFVKRFASRHVANPLLRPRLVVRFDDTIQDNHQNFYFDSSGTLFLRSYNRSSLSNIVSGSALTAITGTNSLVLDLKKGTYTFSVTGSQHTQGTNGTAVAGVYSASFAIPSNVTSLHNKSQTLAKLIAEKGEVEFVTYWKSLDYTVGYHTGSLTIKRASRDAGEFISRDPQIVITNANPIYNKNDTVKIRLFGRDLKAEEEAPVKIAWRRKPVIFEKVYYQVVDRVTEKVILPYDATNDSTRVSTDADGMFFDFKMQALTPGRSYAFDFYVVERGNSYLVRNREAIFTVRD